MSAKQESFAYVAIVGPGSAGPMSELGVFVLPRVPCVGETIRLCSTWEVVGVQHEATDDDIEFSCAVVLVRKAKSTLPVPDALRSRGTR
jgi:hypothetical protein